MERLAKLVKSIMFRLITVIGAIIVCAALLELGCRILPMESAYINIPRVPHPTIGYTRPPNSRFTSEKVCYSIDGIEFNRYGFRGRIPESTNIGSIVVLGDSYMEAREIPERAVTWGIMSGILHRPVLNLSTAGYGVGAQMAAYRERSGSVNPKVVVLFFYCGNDVKDNSCELTKLYGEPITQPCGYIESDQLHWNTDFDETGPIREEGRIKPFLRRHCVSCNVLYRVLKFRILNKSKHGELDFLYNAFRREVPQEWKKAWQEAWLITEKALVDLKDKANADDARLIVVSIPHTLGLAPDWKEMLKDWSGLDKIPEDLDMGLCDERLKEITDRNNIPFLALAPVMKTYMRNHELKDPYLWFFCDGHWNPVGHFIAANATSERIIENDLLVCDPEEKRQILNSIRDNLNLSPGEIMGDQAYDQIYGNKLYKGALGGKLAAD